MGKVVEKIEIVKQALGNVIEKYRTWGWPVGIICLIGVHFWAPNTVTNWPFLPLVIGMVALYFAMHGDCVFSKELFYTDYFLFTTACMAFVMAYGMVLGIISIAIIIVFGL